jgi:hypothetical protein
LAVFSFRYDAHLVPALIENIESMTDGWIAYDDTTGDGVFSNEVQRRAALLTAARDAGARWALAIDPDERFESRLAAEIGRLTKPRGAIAYTFPVRELYSPDQYRVDGIWNGKRQARLLSLTSGVIRPPGELHTSWASFISTPQLRETDFNLYHLKMITTERRKARAALYNHLDPERRMQAMGYDYLADDNGVQLKRIAAGRGYHPAHQEDGGLWMPDVATST